MGYFNHFIGDDRPFRPDEGQIAALLARQAGLVIQKHERDALSRLNQLLSDMTEAEDESSLLDLVLDGALRIAGTDRGWIAKLNLQTKALEIKKHRGNPAHLRPLALGQGITGWAAKAGEPVRVHDVRGHADYQDYWPDTRSELAAPVTVEKARVRVGDDLSHDRKPIGVLNIESPEVGAFLPFEERCLVTVARHAANILDRFEFDGKVAAVSDIQLKIVNMATWEEVIEGLVTSISKTLGYEYVNVSLVHYATDSIKPEHVTGIPAECIADFKREADRRLDSDNIKAHIVRTGKVEVPPRDDSRVDRALLTKYGLEDLVQVFIPLRARPTRPPFGTVAAGYRTSYSIHLYERDINMLKQLVDYAGAALGRRLRMPLDSIVHELMAPVVGLRSNASFLRRRWRHLDATKLALKLDDMVLDADVLDFQSRQIEYALAGERPLAHHFAPTLVYRDVITKYNTPQN